MMEDETDRRLHEIGNKLMIRCAGVEPGEWLSHEQVVAQGWLEEEDLDFLVINGMKVEVTQWTTGEPWVRFELPGGGHRFMGRGSGEAATETATVGRDNFAAFVHRIILEGRDPTIWVKIPGGFTLLIGGKDRDPNGMVSVEREEMLPSALRESWRAIMEDYSVHEIFDHHRGCAGHWMYSHRVPKPRLARCAEAILFEMFALQGPVEISCSENIFMH